MGINRKLFRKHFNFQGLSDMLKSVYSTNNKRKNNELVNVIKSGLKDLENEIENMSEDKIKIEKPNKIVDTVEKILEFNSVGNFMKELPINSP